MDASETRRSGKTEDLKARCCVAVRGDPPHSQFVHVTFVHPAVQPGLRVDSACIAAQNGLSGCFRLAPSGTKPVVAAGSRLKRRMAATPAPRVRTLMFNAAASRSLPVALVTEVLETGFC